MTIVSQAQPLRGKELVHAELGRRLHPGTPLRSLQGTPHVGAALPVYTISRGNAARDDALSRARKTGWRYPIAGGKAFGTALLTKQGGRLVYEGIVEGSLPRRLLRAAARAERELEASDLSFQPRILEIPSLRILALWFFAAGGHSRFILISQGMVQRTSPLSLKSDIKPHIDAANAAVPKMRCTALKRAKKKRQKPTTPD